MTSNKNLKEHRKHLAYAYKVDPDAPGFISKSSHIFNLDEDDVEVTPNYHAKVAIEYSDSKLTAAERVAAGLGVNGSYGVFSAAASMSVSSGASSSHRTVRLDSFVKANLYQMLFAGEAGLDVHLKLKEAVKRHLLQDPPNVIEKKIGEFVPVSCCLGGLYRESYIMDAEENDTESKVSAEVKARYGAPGCAVAAKVSADSESRHGNSSLSMKVEWFCQGGDPAVWLKATKDNAVDIREKWAESVDHDNLCPLDMKLMPIWELIEPLDKAKASEVQKYLMDKWERMKVPMPTSFKSTGGLTKFKANLKYRIVNSFSGRALYAHPNGTWGLDRCGAGTDVCVGKDGEWYIKELRNGQHRIVNAVSNRALFAAADWNWSHKFGAGPDGEVGMDGSWKIEEEPDGTFTIVNGESNRKLFANVGGDWGKLVGAGYPPSKVGTDGYWKIHHNIVMC